MVLTQSFHGESEIESYRRPSQRPIAKSAYYDRAAPYGYYDPSARYELRQEYGGRVSTHTSIQEPEESLTGSGQARRRIAVACARCRRRKIKCSGDPGDGAGCQGCRASGKLEECSFRRINSDPLEFRSPEDGTETRQYNMEASPIGMAGLPTYPVQHRQSLPTLQTRLAWPAEYDNQYESSPVDSYTCSSAPAPRLDSLGNSYASSESCRNYSTSGPLSTPVSSPLCESNSYSFGTLLSPMPNHAISSRLPSVSSEAMSPLNMGSLHSSLPSHEPLERRLPVPFTISYPQQTCMSQSFPEPRLVDPATANFRPYINGVHSRNAMPWSLEANNSRSGSMSSQLPAYQSAAQDHQHHASAVATTSPLSDPVLGYQFQQQSAYSPDSSPTTVATVDESFPTPTTAPMLPPSRLSTLRGPISSTSLPAISLGFSDGRSSSSSRPSRRQPTAPLTSLYSFSSESAERNAADAAAAEHTK